MTTEAADFAYKPGDMVLVRFEDGPWMGQYRRYAWGQVKNGLRDLYGRTYFPGIWVEPSHTQRRAGDPVHLTMRVSGR